MTAKEFLKQAYIAHGEVEVKLELITRLQSLAEKTTTTLKATPFRAGFSGSRVENSVVAIQEEINRLTDEINGLLKISKEISDAIRQIKNPAERKILEYRYLCFFSWQQISLLTKSSTSKVYRLHNQALENFSQMKVFGSF